VAERLSRGVTPRRGCVCVALNLAVAGRAEVVRREEWAALAAARQRLAAAQQRIAALSAEIDRLAQERQATATEALRAEGAIVALEGLSTS
jgi:predicted  nucleic acid-binding Zn-ribbon protein